MHQLHVLLLRLPGDRPRRSDRFRRSGAARSAWPDRARSAQRSRARSRASLAQSGIFNCVSCYKCEEVCPASIPIVSQVIEPLKAKAARSFPAWRSHALALRAIVAARGRVDPGALVLRVQGLRAFATCRAFCAFCVRGKIDPLKTLLMCKTAAASAGAAYPRMRDARNEICLLPRLLGAQHLCRAQCRDPSRRAQAGARACCSSNRPPAPARASCAPSTRSASTRSTCESSRSPNARACR